jgi:WhiB family redox-sensing transcriptional regulator
MVADPFVWQEQAFCQRFDADDWYQRPDDPRTRKAKARCALCPVRGQCLEQALADDEPWGTWGGLTVAERTELLRGRPPIKERRRG